MTTLEWFGEEQNPENDVGSRVLLFDDYTSTHCANWNTCTMYASVLFIPNSKSSSGQGVSRLT